MKDFQIPRNEIAVGTPLLGAPRTEPDGPDQGIRLPSNASIPEQGGWLKRVAHGRNIARRSNSVRFRACQADGHQPLILAGVPRCLREPFSFRFAVPGGKRPPFVSVFMAFDQRHINVSNIRYSVN